MINLIHGDCMEYMATLKDNEFDLAVVDPPYGINYSGQKLFISNTNTKHNRKYHKDKGWDSKRPSKEYFDELRRVSKNQIIWGGNYFADFLPASRGWCVWDKIQKGLTMSDGELAWTSYKIPLRIFEGGRHLLKGSIHPTQKPIQLYQWIFDNYAQKGWRILDTHLGSGSSAIAAHDCGLEFVGLELDGDYFQAAKERLETHQRQLQFPW